MLLAGGGCDPEPDGFGDGCFGRPGLSGDGLKLFGGAAGCSGGGGGGGSGVEFAGGSGGGALPIGTSTVGAGLSESPEGRLASTAMVVTPPMITKAMAPIVSSDGPLPARPRAGERGGGAGTARGGAGLKP